MFMWRVLKYFSVLYLLESLKMWPGYFLQKQNMHQFNVLFNECPVNKTILWHTFTFLNPEAVLKNSFDCVFTVLVSFSEYRLDNII